MNKPQLTKEELEYKIDIATQTLERNIAFVANCDNKTSIVLTTFGVLLTLFLSMDVIEKLYAIIGNCCKEPGLIDILYLITFGISVLLTIGGMIILGSVLIPNTSKKHTNKPKREAKNLTLNANKSLIFFTGIRNHKITDYPTEFKSMTLEELLDDLLNEIYANADIATKKYEKFSLGFKLSAIGFALLFVFFLLGICYYEFPIHPQA